MEQSNFNMLITQYLSYCQYEKGLDSKTQKAYRTDLLQFSDYTLGRGSVLSKNSLQAYLIELHRIYKVKSIKRKITSLKAFFNYLGYEEILPHNPFDRMRIKLHEPLLLPKTIPLNTVDAILRCAYGQKESTCNTPYQMRTTLRNIAILELLFATGMRVSELCFLRKDSVNLQSGEIKIYGKGSKERLASFLSLILTFFYFSITQHEFHDTKPKNKQTA